MRVAPPVQAWSCGAGPWRWFQQALYALGAAVVASWACSHLFGGAAIAVLAGIGSGAAAAALAGACLRAPPVQLQWDGAVWTLRRPAHADATGRVTLMLDLGGWMLVRFVPESSGAPWAASWLPLRCRDLGVQWRALRVALYAAPPRAAAGDGPRRAGGAAAAPAGT